MVLSQSDAVDATVGILPAFKSERDRLDKVDAYIRGEHAGPYVPRNATREYKLLAERSVTNLIPLVINGVVQALRVDGMRRSDTGATSPAWRWWQANRMDGRQSAIHRAAIGYGSSYITVLHGENGFRERMPVIRGHSPRRMIAVYDDADDWPMYALHVEPSTAGGDKRWALRLYDDAAVYYLSSDVGGDHVEYIEHRPHGIGVCPVIAFRDVPDLEGRAPGQVEPLIPVQDRINQTVFDLLVSQTFGSFKVRTVAGMTPELDANGQPKPLPVDQRRFLMAKDPATKWGQLDETDLRPLIASADASMRHMAVISQTPPQDLLGDLTNLAAEALVAARDGQTRKRSEAQLIIGESWEQTLQLAAHLAGDRASATDTASQVTWADLEARSLSMVADALGKLAAQLGIPPEALWPRIPGVTATDIEGWKQLADQQRAADPMARVAAAIDRQAAPAA